MGKICPQCNYHFPDGAVYQQPQIYGCQHDFYMESERLTATTGVDNKNKWRCRRCLEVRYTND